MSNSQNPNETNHIIEAHQFLVPYIYGTGRLWAREARVTGEMMGGLQSISPLQ